MAVGVDIVSTFNDKGVKAAKDGLSGLLSKVNVTGVAFTAAFASIAAGIGAAAKAAADDEASFTQLANTLRNVTGASDEAAQAIDKQLGKMAMATGVADDKLRPALATLVRATGDVAKAQDVLGLAMDISAGTGRDLDSVSLALARAYGGQVTGLSKLGVTLSEEAKSTKDFTLVQKELAAVFGGAAQEKSRTFAGSMERLKVVLGEMVETVGSWLLPALTTLANFLNDVLGRAFTFLSETIGPQVSANFERLGKIVSEYIVPIINEYLVPAFAFLREEIATKIMPIVKMLYDVMFERIAKVFVLVREKLDENRDSFKKIGAVMSDALTVVRDKLLPAFIAFTDFLFNVGLKVLGKVIDVVFRLFEVLTPVAGFLSRVVGAAVDGIVAGVNVAIDAINALIKAWNFLPDWLRPGGQVALIPKVTLGGSSTSGGFGYFGENRGAMPTGVPAMPGAGLDVSPRATGGSSGGRAAGAPGGATGDGGQSFASLGFGAIGMGWDLSQIPIYPMPVEINVNGGLATSAEIGAAVVDAIRSFNRVSGPADIAVA